MAPMPTSNTPRGIPSALPDHPVFRQACPKTESKGLHIDTPSHDHVSEESRASSLPTPPGLGMKRTACFTVLVHLAIAPPLPAASVASNWFTATSDEWTDAGLWSNNPAHISSSYTRTDGGSAGPRDRHLCHRLFRKIEHSDCESGFGFGRCFRTNADFLYT